MPAGRSSVVTRELERTRQTERWIAWVRLAAVPFAIVDALVTSGYPPGHEAWAWTVNGALALGAVALLAASRRELAPRAQARLGLAALGFDGIIASALAFVYVFEAGTPARQLLYLPVIEAALRFGRKGGIALPLLFVPVLAGWEWWRSSSFASEGYDAGNLLVPFGLQLVIGAIVGQLAARVRRQSEEAESRASEAEELRDQIERRATQLDAVNRCARALSSTLNQEEAFELFLREARSAFAFDRLGLVLATEGRAEVLAASGVGADELFTSGTSRPIEGSILEAVLRDGGTAVREDMATDRRFAEEAEFARVGLRSRVVAPLVARSRTLGVLSVARREPAAFEPDEIELVTLLARQVAAAVENIHAFMSEHRAAEELRRLADLRADFVSLVSHELRTPMASVIGCAETLRERWDSLTTEQRESFLRLIEEQTSHVADLLGDVLDTSRLDAGTFPYSFRDVDVADLVHEAAAVARVGQEEVAVRAEVDGPLPVVRGDRDRLRQLLLNLLTNAVKYTVDGDEVEVRARAANGAVTITVRDNGPGIPREHHEFIFEKFGRANTTALSKPGTGLGLFIARSIAEAHGGSLEVASEAGAGATFTLELPAGTAAAPPADGD